MARLLSEDSQKICRQLLAFYILVTELFRTTNMIVASFFEAARIVLVLGAFSSLSKIFASNKNGVSC